MAGRTSARLTPTPARPDRPRTLSPRASARFTERNVLVDALTVTRALGRTLRAPSAEDITSTAGVPAVLGSGEVWGVGPAVALAWQAVSRTLSASTATAQLCPRRGLAEVVGASKVFKTQPYDERTYHEATS